MGRKTFEIAKSINFARGMALGLLSQGVAFSSKGDYPNALNYHLQSLRISENNGLEGLTGNNYTNVGIIYADMEEYDKALDYYNRAYKIAEKDSSDYTKSGILINIADLYKEKNNPDLAIEYNYRAMKLAEKIQDSLKLSVTLLNIGDDYIAKRQPEKALYFLQQSLYISKKISNYDGQAYAYTSIASAYNKLDNNLLSVKFALRGLQQAKSMTITELIRDSYRILSSGYEHLGNFKTAFQYKKLEIALNDSLFSVQRQGKVKLLQYDYDLEKKQHQIDLLNKDGIIRQQEMKQEKGKGYILSCAALLFIIIILYLVAANRRNKRFNKILRTQNEMIILKHRELEESDLIKNKLLSLKNKLFSVIAHDLRTPLYSLGLLFKNIRRNDLPGEEIKAMVPEIIIELNQTSSLMENVLHWAKSQMEAENIHPTLLDITKAVAEVVKSLQSQAFTKQISIYQSVEAATCAYIDKDIFHLVLRNLISNAIKFVPEKGNIFLTTEKEKSHLRILVRDTGIGIKPEILNKLKEDSFYTSKGTAGEAGSGLGLMLCRNFLLMSGGELNIQSQPGDGSTFSFTIPLAID